MFSDDEFFSESQVLTRTPIPLLPQCGRCKLDTQCKTPKMRVDGEGQKGILVIGERPGWEEDRDGKPLIGETGEVVRKMLRNCDVNFRRDCWITNAIICKPKNEVVPATVDWCRPNAIKAIKKLKPSVIILLGGDAVRSVIGWLWKPNTGPISRWAGWRIPSIELNAWVCPTYQPAQLFHSKDPVLGMELQEHLSQAAALAGTRPFPDGVPDYDSQVEIIHSADDAARRLRQYTSGMVAYDYETTCLKPDSEQAEIICCSVCWNGKETIAFPWYGAVKSALSDILANPDIGKIAANLKMEDRWTTAKLGIRVRGWAWDTMLAAHVLSPRGGKDDKDKRKEASGVTGLKFQAFVHLGVRDYSHHIEPFLQSKVKGGNNPNRIREIRLDDVLHYCSLDSLYEYELAQIQMKEMGW